MKKMIQTKFNHEIQCIGYVSYNLVRIANMYSIFSGFFKLTIWKMTIFHWSLYIKQNLYIIFMVYFKFRKKMIPTKYKPRNTCFHFHQKY